MGPGSVRRFKKTDLEVRVLLGGLGSYNCLIFSLETTFIILYLDSFSDS
jgi:hypothetical protein